MLIYEVLCLTPPYSDIPPVKVPKAIVKLTPPSFPDVLKTSPQFSKVLLLLEKCWVKAEERPNAAKVVSVIEDWEM